MHNTLTFATFLIKYENNYLIYFNFVSPWLRNDELCDDMYQIGICSLHCLNTHISLFKHVSFFAWIYLCLNSCWLFCLFKTEKLWALYGPIQRIKEVGWIFMCLLCFCAPSMLRLPRGISTYIPPNTVNICPNMSNICQISSTKA